MGGLELSGLVGVGSGVGEGLDFCVGVGAGVGVGEGVGVGDLGDGAGLGDGLGDGVVSLVEESVACVAELPAKSETSAVMERVPSAREERSRFVRE